MFRPVQNFFWQLIVRLDLPGAGVSVVVDAVAAVAVAVVVELYYSVEGIVDAVIFRCMLRRHR